MKATNWRASICKISQLPSPMENFTISYEKAGEGCKLHIEWDKTKASVDITAK